MANVQRVAGVALEIQTVAGQEFAFVRVVTAGFIDHNAVGAVFDLGVGVGTDVDSRRRLNRRLHGAGAVRIPLLRGVSRRVVRLAEEVFAVSTLRVAVFAHAPQHQIRRKVAKSFVVCHFHPSRGAL